MLTNVAHLFNFTCLATVGGKLGLFSVWTEVSFLPVYTCFIYDATVLSNLVIQCRPKLTGPDLPDVGRGCSR